MAYSDFPSAPDAGKGFQDAARESKKPDTLELKYNPPERVYVPSPGGTTIQEIAREELSVTARQAIEQAMSGHERGETELGDHEAMPDVEREYHEATWGHSQHDYAERYGDDAAVRQAEKFLKELRGRQRHDRDREQDR